MGIPSETAAPAPPKPAGRLLLELRGRVRDLSESPLVMGILNVTPDSFSDGGDYSDPSNARDRALAMIADGADIIDVGPESTRPGAGPVSVPQQIARSVPVIEAIRAVDDAIPVSIDTRLASVARAAIDAGADMVNDVSALGDDPGMAPLIAEVEMPVVLMHRRGTAADMQRGGGPRYDDVIAEIAAFLGERIEFASSRGIARERIVLDPGIGFGKRVEHNLRILRRLDRFTALGRPLLVGASRKSFLGAVLGIEDPKARDASSLVCAVLAALAGAAILRVHDVRATRQMVHLLRAVRLASLDAPHG